VKVSGSEEGYHAMHLAVLGRGDDESFKEIIRTFETNMERRLMYLCVDIPHV
jgi:hypothetical protein